MKRHQILMTDLADFKIEHKIAGQFGNGHHKSLICVVDILTMNAHFELFEKRKLLSTLPALDLAIAAYNDI